MSYKDELLQGATQKQAPLSQEGGQETRNAILKQISRQVEALARSIPSISPEEKTARGMLFAVSAVMILGNDTTEAAGRAVLEIGIESLNQGRCPDVALLMKVQG